MNLYKVIVWGREFFYMSRKVLLVEDAATVRLMQRKILEENNYIIVGEASNGVEAIEKHRALKPDITILDITMPGMDGVTALKYIKGHKPDAKVIMCSAHWTLKNVVEALMGGAMDFVSKPFQRDRFLFTVNSALDNEWTFDTELLSALADECESHEDLPISQDQISELISYVVDVNAGHFNVGDILEKLGFLYQESMFTESALDKILNGQEKIIQMLDLILQKLK